MSFEPIARMYNDAMTHIQNLQGVFNECCEVGKKACDVAKDTWEYVNEQGETISKTIAQWSEDNLPKPITEIAKKAIASLPVSVAFCLAPASVLAGLAVVWIVAHQVKGNLFDKETYDRIANGIGFGAVAQAIESAIHFAQTTNPIAAIATVIASNIAAACFAKASQQ